MWRVISAIPDEGEWRQAKQFCLQGDQDLSSIVTTLQSYERPVTDTTTTGTAALAHSTQSSSSQHFADRGRRGFGRRRGRGRGYRRGGRGNQRGERSMQDRRDKCFFCGKLGHQQRDYHKYKQAREALNKLEDEHANIVSHFSQSEPDSTLYAEDYALVTPLITSGLWTVDSAATHHYSGFTGDFTTLKRWAVPRTVRTADGSRFEALGYGNIELHTTCGPYTLQDTWYIPQFNCRLVSTTMLNDQGIAVTFEKRTVRATYGANVIFTGSGNQGLYYVDLQSDSALATTSTLSNTDLLLTTSSVRELWHDRLGHVSYKTVEQMPKFADGIVLPKMTPTDRIAGETACESCLAGRMKESFNKKTDNRATRKLVRLHCDISGIQVESIRGYRYSLEVIDDATRCTWIRYLKGKAAQDCVPVFKQLIEELEHKTGCKVIYVRADNGKGEFGVEFQNYLRTKSIIFEPSPAFKHSLNGVIERATRTFKDRARSMMYKATAPIQLWCYATEHAVYLKNRLLTDALPYGDIQARTPLEAFTGRKPNFDVLRK